MDDKLSIHVNGAERSLFMSYGLLNRCAKIVQELEEPSQFYVDIDAQERVICEVLRKYAPDGKENPSIDDFEMSVDESRRLIEWVAEHVIDFFLKGLEGAKKTGDRFYSQMAELLPSSTGTEDSDSTTQSAGLLEQSQAD